MTGTAREASGELWRTYRLAVVRVPTHRPVARRELPDRVFGSAGAKWDAIRAETLRLRETGRPVLIGTRSVEASERIGAALEASGESPSVLSATRHAEEAQIVARAGQAGAVTVATNMAGRGTDIRLGEGVAEAGGLAVLASERHESRRIDRQLFGRSGRQGDPGSAQAFVSLEDELVRRYAPRLAAALRAGSTGEVRGAARAVLARLVFRHAERRASGAARRMRAGVLRSDDWLDDSLGFTGRSL
jgi:preprotein translocase subunit SecA